MQICPTCYKITIEEKYQKSISNPHSGFGCIKTKEPLSVLYSFKRSLLGVNNREILMWAQLHQTKINLHIRGTDKHNRNLA